jgi:hypothetical protein
MRTGVGYRYPVLFDRAIRPDEGRRANSAFRNFALSILAWPPGAVGFHGFLLWIGQQNERQVKLTDETVVGVEAIGTDTDDNAIGLTYVIDSVAEPARFPGSARSIVLGIKPENYIFAGVVGERVLLPVTSRQRERRRLLSF